MKKVKNFENSFFTKKLNFCFNKMSKFIIFQAIGEGISQIGIFVFAASLLIVLINLPNLLGLKYSNELKLLINKFWSFSLGLISLFLAGTTAKAISEILNNKLPMNRQIDTTGMMIIAMFSYLIVTIFNYSNKNIIAININNFGAIGILLSLIVGIFCGYICFAWFKINIPISQKIKNIPGSFFWKLRMAAGFLTCMIILIIISYFSHFLTKPLNNIIDNNFSKYIRNNADQWWGLALIYGGYSLSWFCGIHGPSAWAFLSNPINTANDYFNQQIFLNKISGPYHVMTWGSDNFIGCFGGTGATFVLPFLLIFATKNKKLQTTGKMACTSTIFGANEPILYGMPLILNRYFLLPMILAPIGNAFLLKVFIDYWHMRGFITPLNWTVPGPIGIFIGTAFDWKSLILVLSILIWDSLLYLPFLKWYEYQIKNDDNSLDNQNKDSTASKIVDFNLYSNYKINILVICAGGATSGVVANQLKKIGSKKNIKIEASGSAYGNHKELLKKADIVILAPQIANNEDVIIEQIKQMQLLTKVLVFKGQDYLKLSQNSEWSLSKILENIDIKK